MIGIILGTRPELIKIYPVVSFFKKKKIQYKIIHTGQHYSGNLSKIFLKDFKVLKPDYNLKIGSKSHAQQTAQMMISIEKIIRKNKFKAIIVYGDTNSALAGALVVSKYKNIKLIHLEAGLRSFDKNMPEELNRRLIDHASDILFCPTSTSKKYLISEDINPKKIFVIGNTICDAIKSPLVQNQIKKALNITFEYAVLTIHREENTENENNLKKIIEELEKFFKKTNIKIIFPVHPKTKKLLNKINYDKKNIKAIDPMNYFNFLKLIKNSKIIFSDSGGIQEEACIMKIPLITIRNSTERPETLKIGCNILSKISQKNIYLNAIKIIKRKINWRNPYGDGKASQKLYYIIKKYLKKNEPKKY